MSGMTSVLVTGVGGRSVGHQILSALTRVPERYRVVATDVDAFSFGLYVADARYVVPHARDAQYLPSVFEIIEREQVQVVLPGTETELRVLAAARADLEARGCVLIASDKEIVDLCLNKASLHTWLLDNGYDAPRTAASDEWKDLAARTGFPIVGKPSQDSGGSKGVALLADEDEVRSFVADNERRSTTVIFQEYVGSADSEYTVGVLIDRDGGVIDSIVLHRNLFGLSLGVKRVIQGKSYALSTGYSQGFIETHPRVAAVCESLAVKLGIRGPANIQLRVHGDAIKVFEVHPRFSGTTSIRAECGFNEPDVLIRNFLFGETSGRLGYQRDVAAIRAFQTVIVPIDQMRAVSRLGRAQ
jgi:carbamoyl-phosphate synthase large subunit